MPAQILTLRPVSRNSRLFATFDDVLAFELPDPVWVSPDLRESRFSAQHAAQYAEFFTWFGVRADMTGPAESLAAGWEYLGSELGTAYDYRTHHPQTFASLCGSWSCEQLAYLDAVVAGRWADAAALCPRTPVWCALQAKMRTPEGCALKV